MVVENFFFQKTCTYHKYVVPLHRISARMSERFVLKNCKLLNIMEKKTFTQKEAELASVSYFGGDELAARARSIK